MISVSTCSPAAGTELFQEYCHNSLSFPKLFDPCKHGGHSARCLLTSSDPLFVSHRSTVMRSHEALHDSKEASLRADKRNGRLDFARVRLNVVQRAICDDNCKKSCCARAELAVAN